MKRIALVVGEASGDLIGADLIAAIRKRAGSDVELTGLGGTAMAEEGLRSLFDIDELSIIGISAIVGRLPQLLRRLSQVSDHIVRWRPDVLVLIDSPTFSHRVAKRVRKRLPDIPIINYVPPTVWAWREARAPAMRAYIDHALCVLPFEPQTLARLGGPEATYVGHPVMQTQALAALPSERIGPRRELGAPRTLLLLPGSRTGEVARLIDDFGKTYARLSELTPSLRAVLPTFERHRERIEAAVAQWPVKPEVVYGTDAKWTAFTQADAALAASGTVSFELALAGVPMALAYRLDPVAYRIRHLITAWTAAMPNFIVGHPLVPEHFHEMVRPEHLARRLHRLVNDTPERAAQLAGFQEIRRLMHVERPSGEAAADVVLGFAERGRSYRPLRDAVVSAAVR